MLTITTGKEQCAGHRTNMLRFHVYPHAASYPVSIIKLPSAPLPRNCITTCICDQSVYRCNSPTLREKENTLATSGAAFGKLVSVSGLLTLP